MDWVLTLLGFFALLFTLMLLRVPIAISFLAANLAMMSYLVGFERGGATLTGSMYSAVSTFVLTPVPLFILMGELLFKSGVAMRLLEVLNNVLGRLPGRLSVLAVLGGTVFGVLSGSSLANTSMLGRTLVPEMHKRGYSTKMSVGSVTAGGGMAALLPPSALMVLIGGVGGISIGGLLLGGVVPGLILAIIFIGYIIISCARNPSLAPYYETEVWSWPERIRLVSLHILPLLVIIGSVLGLILWGIATPTESAAVGVAGVVVLILAHRALTPSVLRKALTGTVMINGMLLLIVASASGYSQLLAYSGATRAMVAAMTGLAVPGLALVALFLLGALILGMFMDSIAIMMVLIPLTVPTVVELGYNPVWYGILFLICLDIGGLTPPVGLLLFVMKGVVPPDITMPQIMASVWPFVWRELALVVVILFVPGLVLWLPSLMS